MLKVCLTGATGFVGSHLLEQLKVDPEIEVIALSRNVSPKLNFVNENGVEWRRCNGFSLIDVENATEGADVLIYLIHSMLPTSTLSQGSFPDFDLYLADNFARASKKNGIKKIIYLSGIIPESDELSSHLKSRLEVEAALAQFDNDLTVLRSGLIIGENGSSFKILKNLVKRLPIIICPSWAQSKTHPIDLKDVLISLVYCIKNFTKIQKRYDIGGPDIVTYQAMLYEAAKALGKKRLFFTFTLIPLNFSKLWVSRISSTPAKLVYPLVDSLTHQMIADSNFQLKIDGHKYISLQESIHNSLKFKAKPKRQLPHSFRTDLKWLKNVTSLQRVKLSPPCSAQELAHNYFRWLPSFLKPFINVTENDGIVYFRVFNFFTLLILEKCKERSVDKRIFWYVKGGLLANKSTLNGRLEFRVIESSSSIIIGLLDYRPRLPWYIYKYSQALIHLFVMKTFQKYIKKTFPRDID